MAWVDLGAAAIGAAGSIYSSSKNKAQAPATVPYNPLDPTQVQKNAIAGDISTLGDASALAGSTNLTAAQQALAARNITQPGYSSLAGAINKQATSLAENPYELPQGVVDQLNQFASENNISEGTGASSGFSGSNLLRSLGINELQYGQTNLSAATSALATLSGTAPNISPVSPLSFLLTPAQALNTQTTNNTNAQQIGQGAANASAAAANANSANLWDTITSQISPLTSAGAAAINGPSGTVTTGPYGSSLPSTSAPAPTGGGGG